MDGIEYRKSGLSDFDQIAGLLKRNDLNMSDMKADGFMVAARAGRILGCARIIEMDNGSIELASVAVVEGCRGMGIGRKVVEAVLGSERRRPIYLMCKTSNKEFYEKFGFREIKDDLLPGDFRKDVDRIKKHPKYRNIEGLSMVKR